MKKVKYISGLIVALLAILMFSSVASAAAVGKADCNGWSYNATSIVKKIQIKIDGNVKKEAIYSFDGNGHAESGEWNLGPGNHVIVITDWSYGDLSDEYDGPDKAPQGHVIFSETFNCGEPTTTTELATTTTALPETTVTTVAPSTTIVSPVTSIKSSETTAAPTTLATTTTVTPSSSTDPATTTTVITSTTSVTQTTDPSPTNTLPATGSSPVGFVAAAVICLLLGCWAWAAANRRPRLHS